MDTRCHQYAPNPQAQTSTLSPELRPPSTLEPQSLSHKVQNPEHLLAGRFNAVDTRCGMALDAIDPPQWALLETASLDTNLEPIPYRPPSIR